MDYRKLDIAVSQWQVIDGCVDNSMSVDVVEGEILSTLHGGVVRDAGWRASAHFQGERDRYGWPPQEHLLEIELRREHWDFVLEQLRRWSIGGTDNSALIAELNARLDCA